MKLGNINKIWMSNFKAMDNMFTQLKKKIGIPKVPKASYPK